MGPRGFSLIELMVTVSVLAILLALGLPSFQSSLQSNRVSTANNELVAAFALARSEAIRNTQGSGVCPSVSGTECDEDGQWSDGWIIWNDENSNGELDDDEEVVRIRQAIRRIDFSGDASPIAFDSRGRLLDGGDVQIDFQPNQCPEGRELKRSLSINASGQVKTSREACG